MTFHIDHPVEGHMNSRIGFIIRNSHKTVRSDCVEKNSLISIFDNLKPEDLIRDKETIGVCLTDPVQISPTCHHAEYAYIPGNYCRQTSFLIRVAQSFNSIILERGAFLPVKDLIYAIEKIRHAGTYVDLTILESGVRISEWQYSLNLDIFSYFDIFKKEYPDLKLALNLDQLFLNHVPLSRVLHKMIDLLAEEEIDFFSNNINWIQERYPSYAL